MDHFDSECPRESTSRISLIRDSRDSITKEPVFFHFTCDLCGREIELEMPDEWLPLDILTENDIQTIKKICSCWHDDFGIAKYCKGTHIKMDFQKIIDSLTS